MTSLRELREQIKGAKCDWCNNTFSKEDVESYPHSGGWQLDDLDYKDNENWKKYWVYVHCKTCDYDFAIRP